MIPVGWLAPTRLSNNPQWDQTLVEDLFTGRLYEHGLTFRDHVGYPNTDRGCCLVLAGRHWVGAEAEITAAVARYAWLLLIVTGDEEAVFDANAVVHQNCRTWIQAPRQGKTYPEGSRFIGVGYTPHCRSLPKEPPDKAIDVFMSAQRTHRRRLEAFDALEHLPESLVYFVKATDGFTQGMEPYHYVDTMVGAKVAPCPSGAVSCDSFRAWEALESHCVPIFDAASPVDGETDYWERVLPGCPAPVLTDYQSLPGYISEALEQWPANANRIAAFWMRYKRQLALWLREDLIALGAVKTGE